MLIKCLAFASCFISLIALAAINAYTYPLLLILFTTTISFEITWSVGNDPSRASKN